MKRLVTLITTLFLLLIPVGSAAAAPLHNTKAAGGGQTVDTNGYDVSWPNCTATAPTNPTFGIVGITGGTVYSASSCLAKQVGWFPTHSLYVNTGLNAVSTSQYYVAAANSPTVCNGDVYCQAYNYGWNAGLDALSVAQNAGVSASTWWLDVENGNSWSADTNQNRQSLQGERDALAANGVTTIGAYSTTAQWDSITGTWLNNWPNWGATTVRQASQAATFCTGHQFTGGPTYLIQYVGTLDRDYAC